uniref:Uncharacterized protein n=1 Tax=viral metagenome TaxID=1070528 RepID=A0A6C0F6E8_9ZZZZ
MYWFYYYFNEFIKSIKIEYDYHNKKHRRYVFLMFFLFFSILGLNYIPKNINWSFLKPFLAQPLLLDYPIRII